MTDTKNLKLLIDADGIVFAAGFAAERMMYRVRFLKDDTYDWLSSADFRYKKDVDKFLLEQEFEEGEYEIVKWREPEPVANALANARNMLNGVLESLHSTRCELYLTGDGNFRYDIATIQPYKGNRKDAVRPMHEPAIREYMIQHWNAITIDGQEADDAVSIRQIMLGDRSCIVSADKDLDMVPGWHSKIRKCELYYVTEDEGMYHFYWQLLRGDPTDHIQGVPGIGAAYAKRDLPDVGASEQELFEAAYRCYETYHKERAAEGAITLTAEELDTGIRAAMRENGRLLWMRRELEEMWELPDERIHQ